MKHEIEIEGLPNGWEAVAFRTGGIGEHVIDCGKVVLLNATTKFPCLIVKKKQPRRIVLEETAEVRTVVYGDHYGYIEDGIYIGQWDEEEPSIHSYKIWREVKEGEE